MVREVMHPTANRKIRANLARILLFLQQKAPHSSAAARLESGRVGCLREREGRYAGIVGMVTRRPSLLGGFGLFGWADFEIKRQNLLETPTPST